MEGELILQATPNITVIIPLMLVEIHLPFIVPVVALAVDLYEKKTSSSP